MVPSRRLANIRSLHVQLLYQEMALRIHYQCCPDPFQKETEWIEFWDLVGQLPGLRVLEVKVISPPPFWEYGSTQRNLPRTAAADIADMRYGLLDPLRALKGLDRVEVILPTACQAK